MWSKNTDFDYLQLHTFRSVRDVVFMDVKTENIVDLPCND